jgi:glucokinase
MSQYTHVSLGIDLGGTTFAVGAFDSQGRKLYAASYDTPHADEPTLVFDQLAEQAIQAVRAVDCVPIGLGVGIPGVVDPPSGYVFVCPNLKVLNKTYTGPELSKRLNLPVFIANDAFCATLAELRWGAGQDARNMLLLTLGTGIGGGVALDNKVIRGPRQLIGEIGHMVLKPDGPPCGCGNHGCFEALAGRAAIVNLALSKIQSGRESLLTALCQGDLSLIDPRMIASAAQQGDELAIEVLAEIGHWIGVGICNGIVFVDPDVVVLGGGIAGAGEALFGPIRRTVAARSQISRGKFDPANIVAAALGNDAGLYGAAQLVWEQAPEG